MKMQKYLKTSHSVLNLDAFELSMEELQNQLMLMRTIIVNGSSIMIIECRSLVSKEEIVKLTERGKRQQI